MTHQSKITSDISYGFFPSFRTVWTCFTWDLRVFNLTSRGRDGTGRNRTAAANPTRPGPLLRAPIFFFSCKTKDQTTHATRRTHARTWRRAARGKVRKGRRRLFFLFLCFCGRRYLWISMCRPSRAHASHVACHAIFSSPLLEQIRVATIVNDDDSKTKETEMKPRRWTIFQEICRPHDSMCPPQTLDTPPDWR
jgi:hypothetical protein